MQALVYGDIVLPPHLGLSIGSQIDIAVGLLKLQHVDSMPKFVVA